MNDRASVAASLEDSPFFMPFSMNRQFKKHPRLLSRAEGMHYYTPEGRKILDGTAGLWCVNAGHCRAPIVEAIQRQAATMDFAPTFQMGHPKAFELAESPDQKQHIEVTRDIAAKLNSTLEDIDLNLDDFVARVNSDLIGKFINIASRCAGFISKRFDGKPS